MNLPTKNPEIFPTSKIPLICPTKTPKNPLVYPQERKIWKTAEGNEIKWTFTSFAKIDWSAEPEKWGSFPISLWHVRLLDTCHCLHYAALTSDHNLSVWYASNDNRTIEWNWLWTLLSRFSRFWTECGKTNQCWTLSVSFHGNSFRQDSICLHVEYEILFTSS